MFSWNTALDGGGIHFCVFEGELEEPAVRRNAIVDNEAIANGGGVSVLNADPVIENCTFEGNSAGGLGGGVYAGRSYEGPYLETSLSNCIVTNSTSGGGIAREEVPLTTSLCDVWGNAGGDYVNCEPAPDDISADPLFCGPLPLRDLTLRDDSPCLPENNPWDALIGAYGAGGCGTTGVHGEDTPLSLVTLSATPNPFRNLTRLEWSVAADDGDPLVVIHNLKGQRVRTLTGNSRLHTQPHLIWDGRDDDGRQAAAGVYFCTAIVGPERASVKLVLVR